MATCRSIQRRLSELGALPRAALPPEVREHVAGCTGCARALAGARLTRGLLAAVSEVSEPPEDFASRVLRALPTAAPARRGVREDPWAPAWGLLPAFAATASVLLLLFQFQTGDLAARAWPDADGALASLEEGGR